MSDNNDKVFDHWINEAKNSYLESQNQGPLRFIEITRIPRKIDSRALTSLLVSASKIVPINVDISIRQDLVYETQQQVALVEYQSGPDAHLAALRLKTAPFAKPWQIKLVTYRESVEPGLELIET